MKFSFSKTATAILATLLATFGSQSVAQDGLGITLGFGGTYSNSYFGADHYSIGPAGKFSLQRLSLGSLQFGGSDPHAEKLGFGIRGAFGVVGARKALDHPELTGLTDLKTSVEIGFGLGYEASHWRAFADMRYGAIGHHASVVELGADWKAISTPEFKLSVGPRVVYGSGRYNRTYFGVTAADSITSGLAAFTPDAGVVSAGIEVGMTYDLGGDWALAGTLNYDRLQGDAASSPITALGTRDQGSISILLTRRLSLEF